MKYKIRKTGEIVEVLSYSAPMGTYRTKDDCVSFIDSNGNEHPREKGNIYWDFEQIDNNANGGNKTKIDWEQRRYEIAKSVLIAAYGVKKYRLNGELYSLTRDERILHAIDEADALIEELKKRQ